jgi:hypothetical protein
MRGKHDGHVLCGMRDGAHNAPHLLAIGQTPHSLQERGTLRRAFLTLPWRFGKCLRFPLHGPAGDRSARARPGHRESHRSLPGLLRAGNMANTVGLAFAMIVASALLASSQRK